MKRMTLGLLCFVLLLAACGGQTAAPTASPTTSPLAQSGPGFSVQISGDISASLSSANKDSNRFAKNPGDGTGYSFSFSRADGSVDVQILFYSGTAPQSGTYTFTVDVVDGSVSAMAFERSGNGRAFTLGEGKLTLEQTGQSYSGSFTFASKGGAPGSLDQSISVNGSFQEIPLG
jgi:hypothetical protein